MSNKKDILWNRFLKSGHINDYINYKLYLRKKEIEENEANYQTRGNSTESNGL